jgi:hypothetical protein
MEEGDKVPVYVRRYKNTTGYYTSQVFTISGPVFQTNLRKTAFR